MPARETLTAVLRARDQVTGALDDIEQGALAAATAFETAQEAADAFERGLDGVERGAGAVADQLSDIAPSAGVAATAMSAAEERADELGDEFTDTAVEAGVLGGAMSGLPAAGALGGTVGFQTGGIEAPSMPDLSALQFPATDGGQELSALGGAGHVAAEGLDAASAAAIETSAANALAASEADDAADGLLSMVPGGEAAAGALDDVRSSAFRAVPGLAAAKHEIDETGDEAAGATTKVGALSGALAGLGGSGLGGSFAGVHGGLGTIAVTAAALLPIVVSLGGVFGGLAVAAGGLASVVGAGIFGGLLGQAESMVGQTRMVDGELKTLTTTADAMSAIMSDLKEKASDALQPLQAPMFQDLAISVLEGAVTLLGDFAQFAANTYRRIEPLVDAVAGAWWDSEPAFFAAMEDAVTTLAPALAGLLIYLAEAIPQAIGYMTQEASDLLPELEEFGATLVDTLPPLAELGTTVLSVVIPALSTLLDIITPAIQAFNALPDPVKEVTVGLVLAGVAALALVGPLLSVVSAGSKLIGVAGTVGSALGGWATASAVASGALSALGTAASVLASGALTVLSGAMSVVVGGLSAIAGVVGLPVIAIAALAAAIGGVITYFGWWDDIMNTITGTIDTIIGGLQFALLSFAGLFGQKKAMKNFFSGVTYWLDRVAGALRVVGEAYDAAAGFFDHIGGSTDEWVGRQFDNTPGSGPPGGNQSGGGMTAGQGGRVAEDSKGGPGSPPGPQQPPGGPGGAGAGGYGGGAGSGYGGGQAGGAAAAAGGGGGGATVKNEVHYYEQNGDSKSGPARERRVRNIVRQMNDETRRSGTGMN